MYGYEVWIELKSKWISYETQNVLALKTPRQCWHRSRIIENYIYDNIVFQPKLLNHSYHAIGYNW